MNPKLDLPPLPGTLASSSTPDAALICTTDTKTGMLPPSPSSPRPVMTTASLETCDTSSTSSNGSISEISFPPPLTQRPKRAVSFDDSMLNTRSNYDLRSPSVRPVKMERNAPFGLQERLDQTTGNRGCKKGVRLAPIPAFRGSSSSQPDQQQLPEQAPNHHRINESSPSANVDALNLSPVRNHLNGNDTLSITSKAITRLKQQSYGRLKDINFDLPTITEGVPVEDKSIHKMNVTKAPITIAKLEKCVHFGFVYIRTFPYILGDHPCCGKGAPPLAMGWDYQLEPDDDFGGAEFPLEKFEEMRFYARRHGEKQLWISPFRRREILRKARYTEDEIDKAIEEAEKIRRQRASTVKWSEFWMRLGGKPNDVTLLFNVDKLKQTSHAVKG